MSLDQGVAHLAACERGSEDVAIVTRRADDVGQAEDVREVGVDVQGDSSRLKATRGGSLLRETRVGDGG